MSRVAAVVLLFVGAVLLVTWIAAPASSEPQAPDTAGPPADAAPVPAAIGVERVRLPVRPASPAGFEVPERDPFSYAAPASAWPAGPGTADDAATVPVARMPRLPALVAIVADTVGEAGEVTRRAAVRSATGHVRLVTAGQAVDGVVVTEVAVDGVVFHDTVTDTTTRVPLR